MKPCLVCRKAIEPDENIGYENDAVVCTVAAGYGSCHDLRVFEFVVCDDCLEKAVQGGTAIEVIQNYPRPLFVGW